MFATRQAPPRAPTQAASIGGIRVEIFQTSAEIEEAGQTRARIGATRGEKRAAEERLVVQSGEKAHERQGEGQGGRGESESRAGEGDGELAHGCIDARGRRESREIEEGRR